MKHRRLVWKYDTLHVFYQIWSNKHQHNQIWHQTWSWFMITYIFIEFQSWGVERAYLISEHPHVWVVLAAIVLFRSLCSSPWKIFRKKISLYSSPRKIFKKNPPSEFLFSRIDITPQRPKFVPKKENSPISFLLFFLFPFSFLNLPIKSHLPNFKFPSKTFQEESHLP